MLHQPDQVVRALRNPDETLGFTLPEWDLLIRQGRVADLLARIATQLDERGLLGRVPAAAGNHLQAALTAAGAQEQSALREVDFVCKALAPLGIRPILLKGSAYLLAKLPPARGRFFSDIDILVPKSRLAEVEAALMLNGWATTHLDPYDQRYYRQWMHELPPMEHMTRQTILDLHHAILPESARLKPDSARLIAASAPANDVSGANVLAPADMVLHSATHLFHNEELSHGLRDLSDLDLLLRHFGKDEGFWRALINRADELDLRRPLYYGLRYASHFLGTPVPEDILAAARPWRPAGLASPFMDALWARALRTPHRTAADRFTPTALFLLYVRAHWLRMPPHLLVRHLTIKAWRRTHPVEVPKAI